MVFFPYCCPKKLTHELLTNVQPVNREILYQNLGALGRNLLCHIVITLMQMQIFQDRSTALFIAYYKPNS